MPSSVLIRRHIFTFREAMGALLQEDQVDADSYEIRVVDGAVVLDLVNPVAVTGGIEEAVAETLAEHGAVEDAPRLVAKKVEERFLADGEPIGTGSLDAGAPPAAEEPPPPEPERPARPKGGPLAQRAGIICAEGAFAVFMDASSAAEATDALRIQCGIESRAELDHDHVAARKFLDIETSYRVWKGVDGGTP